MWITQTLNKGNYFSSKTGNLPGSLPLPSSNTEFLWKVAFFALSLLPLYSETTTLQPRGENVQRILLQKGQEPVTVTFGHPFTGMPPFQDDS